MPTAADVCQAIDRLGLVPPAQRGDWANSAERAAPAENILATLVRRGWITPFQARALAEGKGDTLRLGNYVLLDLVGEGGMGQVFRARQRDFDEIVCLKVIRSELTGSNKLVRRFDRERQVVTQLSHPNIVAAYDSGEEGDTLFYAMEYVAGIDLGKLVQEKGALPIRESCEYIRQAALGLQHAHQAGLIHRDVKPDNFLLEANTGRIKLLDLGLVRVEPSGEEAAATALTVRGTAIGTPEYMAPEQIRDSTSVDARADLYALGCTFYYLLAGQDPFRGRTPTEVMYQQVTKDPPPLQQVRPEVPAGVAAIVRRLLMKKREERIQTAAELADRLGRLLRSDPKTWDELSEEDRPALAVPAPGPVPRPLAAKPAGLHPSTGGRPIIALPTSARPGRPRARQSHITELIMLGTALLVLAGVAVWWVFTRGR